MNFAWNARLPRSIQESFTCRKPTTWTDGFTSPPKEGVLRIFSPWKIWRLQPGLNPRTWVLKTSTLPLDHRSRFNTTVLTFHDRFQQIMRPYGWPVPFIHSPDIVQITLSKVMLCSCLSDTDYFHALWHETLHQSLDVFCFQNNKKKYHILLGHIDTW